MLKINNNIQSKISIKKFHENRCGFCSENVGLVHNIFKILGIDYQLVTGKRNETIRSGKSPIIDFYIDNIIKIRLETTYPINWLNDMEVGTKLDFSNYLSDITFEDNSGWQSMIIGKYNCELLKKDTNVYNIKLNVESNEFEKLAIIIDEDLIYDFY